MSQVWQARGSAVFFVEAAVFFVEAAALRRALCVQVAIDPVLPPVFEPFDCYSPDHGLDASGRVLFELRDAGAAQVGVWDPDNHSWELLGAPMTDIEDIEAWRLSPMLFAISAHRQNTTFCGLQEWSEPPPEAVVGGSVQLARLDPQLSMVFDQSSAWSLGVDPQELCVVWSTSEGFEFLEFADQDTHSLPIPGRLWWL